MKLDTTLYLVTDSTGLSEDIFLRKIESALQNGVTLLQLREKEKSTREYIALAEKVHEISLKYAVPLIIDDRIDVALAMGAEGVHLGQSDMPVGKAREIMGGGYIIGATTKTVEQAFEAYRQGADYGAVGAIYPTKTKVKTVITPVHTLREICAAVPMPINAIGGLNAGNIGVLRDSGISGICAVSAIMHAEDSGSAARELRQAADALGLRGGV